MPADADIERALRIAVAKLYKSGNLEDLTVKRVRAAVEKELGLSTDFLKSDAGWKDQSKDIINDEVSIQDSKEDEDIPSSPQKSPPSKKTKPGKAKPPVKTSKKRASAPKRPASVNQEAANKRRKLVVESDESSPEFSDGPNQSFNSTKQATNELPESESEEAPTKKSMRGKNKKESPKTNDLARKTSPVKSGEASAQDDALSESEYSVVLDEPPKKARKNQKKESGEKAKPTKSKAKASKSKAPQDLDADSEEIKRLQGWLVKCGIRKMWFKELAPYDTARGKINHLKEMLKDAGMTGRYSAEKARQIKEQRELAADLEAVKEGDKRWGNRRGGDESGSDDDDDDDEDEDSSSGKPKRLARGLRELQFLGDGEETD